MSVRLNEVDLLALIEDELPAEAASALRAELARQPALAARVEALRRDRALLRALSEPEVPPRVLIGLEPWLAKPMLFDAPGTRLRARQNRARHVRWALSGLAAALGVAGLASLWLVVSNRLIERRSEDAIARATDDDGSFLPATPTADAPINGASDGSSDGKAMMANATRETGTVRSTENLRSTRDRAVPSTPLAVQFALVIDSEASAAVMEDLRAWSTDRAAESALVRNLTYAEAERLAFELPRNRSGGSPAIASDDGSSPAAPSFTLNDDMIALLSSRRKPEEAGESSGLVAGRRELGASYDQQLSYAQSGAAFTVSMPLDRLQDLLSALHERGTSATLRPLPAPARPGDEPAAMPVSTTESAWLSDLPAVAAEIRRIEAEYSQAVILLPVVIRAADPARAPRR